MKKAIVSFCVLLICVFPLTGCKQKGAREVATQWLNGLYHYDYDAAKQVSTDTTKIFISTFQQLASMVPDSAKKQLKKVTVAVKDVKEDGDRAIAVYTLSDLPDKEQTLNLVKRDGRWLVQFSKVDQLADLKEQEPEEGGVDSLGNPSSNPVPDSIVH